MECPFCGKIETGVIDSRLTKERTAIRRRRQCSGCAGIRIEGEIRSAK